MNCFKFQNQPLIDEQIQFITFPYTIGHTQAAKPIAFLPGYAIYTFHNRVFPRTLFPGIRALFSNGFYAKTCYSSGQFVHIHNHMFQSSPNITAEYNKCLSFFPLFSVFF